MSSEQHTAYQSIMKNTYIRNEQLATYGKHEQHLMGSKQHTSMYHM